MDRAGFLLSEFEKKLGFAPTSGQLGLLRDISVFVTSGDADILVVNGYAGTGKTTAISAVINTLTSFKICCALMAPTGRAAKVLSSISGRPAYTVHKSIYRQKSVGDDGFGHFTICPNKSKNTLFVVDEASLIGNEGPQGQNASVFGSGDLISDLVSYVRSGADCKLILIGDGAQLPPVGFEESPVLSEEYMSRFGGVLFSQLTEVVRQKKESGILHNATLLREMITSAEPYESFSGFKLELGGASDVERISGGELIEKIADAYGQYGEDETIILCRSNKRAIRYNLGIRNAVQYKEERLVRGDKLMIVKNCYKFVEDAGDLDFLANGDIATLLSIRHYEDRYGLHFADAVLALPDYGNLEIDAKVCLDTLESESPSLTYEQQNQLYAGVDADYSDITSKRKRYEAVREDPFYNAIQLKYAAAITGHKSQGGQWDCVFIDCPFWQDEQTVDDLKWLYTALTRAVKKVYLVNFDNRFFV